MCDIWEVLSFISSFLHSITDNLCEWFCLNKIHQLFIESYTTYFQLQFPVAYCKKYTHLAWPYPEPWMAYSKWYIMPHKSRLACDKNFNQQ